ncbi:substrate-binding domain-containing protein [Shewanella sp. NFH-SH190041]|uniref:substrate-binding domain-containing protein n=1 Tax=Shewanella sp. NFH-SH190041 TaxID=2950245 RepID=UPI0021C3C417|nr:substrate-binding domain-containing protein [Shewanella sp. NFH-SH190041]
MTGKKRRPTLDDIAARVNVTKMTVSRYLRQPESVAESTRVKIEAVIRELGYIPSRVPNMLSKAKSRAIGVVLPSLSNQVFAALVQGIESVTQAAGYEVLLVHYGYNPAEEERKIATLLSYHVDGLILTETSHTAQCLKMIKSAGVPVVETMDLPQQPIDFVVGLDHQQAAFTLVNQMIASGKKHIVYLGARLDKRTQLRMDGYQQAMMAAGLTPHAIMTDAHSGFANGAELFDQAMDAIPQLDGIFCTNDDIAAGAFIRCQSRGLAIPQQIAIAGYNALDIGKALRPQLTSVQTPRFAIGQTAARLLIDKLNGVPVSHQPVDLGFSIFNGGSI